MNKLKQILLTVLTMLSVSVLAQNPINVEVTSLKHNNYQLLANEQLSYSVVIPQTNLDEVKKDWLNYIGKRSRGKSRVENGVFVQFGATNKNISPERFEVYSKLLETTDGVHMTVWLEQNNTAFVSANPNSGLDLAVQKYVRDFAVDQYRNAVQEELIMEERKQAGLEEELAQLIQEQEKSRKTINQNDRSKENTKDVIATNNRDIESTSYKIYDQKDMVELTASDPNANKGARKTLDELKDEKQDLQKENAKQGENIDDWNKENRVEERSMASVEQQILWKTADVEQQRQKVREVKTKLKNII